MQSCATHLDQNVCRYSDKKEEGSLQDAGAARCMSYSSGGSGSLIGERALSSLLRFCFHFFFCKRVSTSKLGTMGLRRKVCKRAREEGGSLEEKQRLLNPTSRISQSTWHHYHHHEEARKKRHSAHIAEYD
jgi:hypothetical protein